MACFHLLAGDGCHFNGTDDPPDEVDDVDGSGVFGSFFLRPRFEGVSTAGNSSPSFSRLMTELFSSSSWGGEEAVEQDAGVLTKVDFLDGVERSMGPSLSRVLEVDWFMAPALSARGPGSDGLEGKMMCSKILFFKVLLPFPLVQIDISILLSFLQSFS